jgi:hypothetical protein
LSRSTVTESNARQREWRRTEYHDRTTRTAPTPPIPNGTSASTGREWGEGRVIATEWSLSDLRRTCPELSSAEPAGMEETGELDLPPRTQLLQPSGTSQLVYLAHEGRHFLFVA